MFDDTIFQQDPLVESLRLSNIVKRPADSMQTPVGYMIVNHNRNDNVKIKIKGRATIPGIPEVLNQNPNTFIDENWDELGSCLLHANNFFISCANAPKEFSFANSFTHAITNLYQANANIQIIVNGTVYEASSFIDTTGGTTIFDPSFLEPYGGVYTDVLGDYKLHVTGARAIRFELRVNDTINTNTIADVQSMFGQSPAGTNETVVYHSNENFYGFTFCIESTSVPSVTRIDYATIETMDELINSGVITTYNNEAAELAIEPVVPGAETDLNAVFRARLLNSFDEPIVRQQDYLLVLESPDVDITALDLSKIHATYNVYAPGTPTPTGRMMRTVASPAIQTMSQPDGSVLVSENNVIDNTKLYRLNGKVVYPMTMLENDNGYFLDFTIDFDGNNDLFIAASHQLNINVSRGSDVTIPLLQDYETEVPLILTNLSSVTFDRFQYYQFAVQAKANHLIYLEALEMPADNIEVTIANKAVVAPIAVQEYQSNATRHTKAWRSDIDQLVVIQVKVPLGLTTGVVTIIDRSIYQELQGVTRSTAGALTRVNGESVFEYTAKDTIRVVKLANNGPQEYSINLFNEMIANKAIVVQGADYVVFAQDVNSIADYSLENHLFTHLTEEGEQTGWIGFNKTKYTTSAESDVDIVMPVSSGLDSYYYVYEMVEGGVRIHYYELDSLLVPVSYHGNSFVPWAYDPLKAITVISGIAKAIGTAYDVLPNELGPLRSSFVLTHNYDVLITDVTEV